MQSGHSERSTWSRVAVLAGLTLAHALVSGACSASSQSGGADASVDAGSGGSGFATRDVPAGEGDTSQSGDAGAETTPAVEDTATGDPDTGAPTEEVGPAADASTPSCDEGAACNDEDSCTKNDACKDGVCAGEAIDCEDGVPCTTDACTDGVCSSVLADGFCRIDGDCWNTGQVDPLQPCRRCVPQVATEEWSAAEGQECDDGESCTAPDACTAAGECEGAPILCDTDDGNPCTGSACEAGECVQADLTGAECDDGEPCTTGEACDKGLCSGGVTDDCDDGLLCTIDSCDDGGGCVNQLFVNACIIDGACVDAGSLDPSNACLQCQPELDSAAWTGLTGTGCSDGDPCTVPDLCQAGVCTSQPIGCPDDGDPCTLSVCNAGDCAFEPVATGGACDDGDDCTAGETCTSGSCGGGTPVDGPDCDGGIGSACTYHTDCYPDVCAVWSTGESKCSAPCAGDMDCPGGQICTKLPGSAQVAFCQDTPAGSGKGVGCSDDTDCASGLCVDNTCADHCLDEMHCQAVDQTCKMVGDLGLGWIAGSCSQDPAGLLASGASCTTDGFTFDGFYCASGHCDLLADLSGLVPSVIRCSNMCTTKNDCLPSQKCGIVISTAPKPNPNAVPYDPLFSAATVDAATACYTPPSGLGFFPDGAVCTANSQCKAGHCLPLLPGDSTAFCTRYCTTDSECQTGMQCKLEAITMGSDWLQAAGAVNLNAWSLVRICKFP